MRDPRERVAHRHGVQRRTPHASFLFDHREAGALQHAHVLGDGGKRHGEARGELADGAIAGSETREDIATRGIGEGGERVVEGFGMVNHMV
jgi:hypothetical protein